MSNIKRYFINVVDLTPKGSALCASLSWSYDLREELTIMEHAVDLWILECVKKYFPKAVLQEAQGEWTEVKVCDLPMPIDDQRAYPEAPTFPVGLYAKTDADVEAVKSYYGGMKLEYIFREVYGGERMPMLQKIAGECWVK